MNVDYIYNIYTKACSYSFLSIKPFHSKTTALVKITLVQLDYTNGVYPIGIGVFATEMLDHLRGWRNAGTQMWCIGEDLMQFGALYRSDGTLFDSHQLGEYNTYRNGYPTHR
jgi:hypothetical protein